MGREGLLDKVVSKQRPSGSQGGGRADRGRTGIPASGNSKSPQGKRRCALKATVIEVEWAEGKAVSMGMGRGEVACSSRRTLQAAERTLDTSLGKVRSHRRLYSRRET